MIRLLLVSSLVIVGTVLAVPLGRAADLPVTSGLTISYSPAERRLFADAVDGRLDEHDLLTAALVAGGVDDPAVLQHYRDRFAAQSAELLRSGRLVGSPSEQARAMFEFLHERILTGDYRPETTELTAAFDRGEYNCVSATILFQCLASRCGRSSQAIERPGHVLARIMLDGQPIDIETTCPEWFDALARRGSKPAADRGDERELSSLGLVAAIYYNRGYESLARHAFAAAVEANLKALRLDPTGPGAMTNYLATLNNWSLELCGHEQYETAVAILRQGIVAAPQYSAFANNFVAVHEHWAAALARQGRWHEALEHVEQAIADQPQLEGLDGLRQTLTRRVGRK